VSANTAQGRACRDPAALMVRTLVTLFVAITLFAPKRATAGERMADLFSEGYQLIYTEHFSAIEGCEYSKRILIGPYIFTCETNEYVFHYGKAVLLRQASAGPFQFFSSAYICVDQDRCLAGELNPR
jgi:hypothetical protein